MDISQFSILGESLIAESSDAVASQASSQPFSPVLSDSEATDLWQRSVSQQTDENISNLDQLSSLRHNCKCACHLFRNGHVSEETPCQGTYNFIITDNIVYDNLQYYVGYSVTSSVF